MFSLEKRPVVSVWGAGCGPGRRAPSEPDREMLSTGMGAGLGRRKPQLPGAAWRKQPWGPREAHLGTTAVAAKGPLPPEARGKAASPGSAGGSTAGQGAHFCSAGATSQRRPGLLGQPSHQDKVPTTQEPHRDAVALTVNGSISVPKAVLSRLCDKGVVFLKRIMET